MGFSEYHDAQKRVAAGRCHALTHTVRRGQTISLFPLDGGNGAVRTAESPDGCRGRHPVTSTANCTGAEDADEAICLNQELTRFRFLTFSPRIIALCH